MFLDLGVLESLGTAFWKVGLLEGLYKGFHKSSVRVSSFSGLGVKDYLDPEEPTC